MGRSDSPLNESSGHHVSQTSRSSSNDTDLTVHGKGSERTLVVLSVSGTDDVVSGVVLAPFLPVSLRTLTRSQGPTVGASNVKLSSTLAIFGSTSTRCFSYAARCFSSSSADKTALVGLMNPRAKTRLEGASLLEGAERRERVKVVRRDIVFRC